MKRIAIVAVSVLCAGLSGVARAADTPVTFTKDVAPILYKSCVECHRPTMFAPMSLLTYDEARRSEEHTSELQSRLHLVCRLLLEKKKKKGPTMSNRPTLTSSEW